MNGTVLPAEIVPPVFPLFATDYLEMILSLLPGGIVMYFSIYALVKRYNIVFFILGFSSIATLFASMYVFPLRCGPTQSLQRFTVAIGTMKMLDVFIRRRSPPKYKLSPRPRDSIYALIIMTELRYESFTPNRVRVPHKFENFSEPMQLGVHTIAFFVLQAMPQVPTILAWEVLLAIYIQWTIMQLVLRYRDSPALFGPLYLADSLTGFWSETWHNAFAAPCESLAYSPLRFGLARVGVPIPIARSLGVMGAFGLMALFHIYPMAPLMRTESLERIGWFFMINGIATVAEGALWGRKRHWLKALFAWIFETCLATWTAQGINIPKGLGNIPWQSMCTATS